MTEEQMLELLEERKYKELKTELENLYPVDIAQILEEFNEKQRIIVFLSFNKKKRLLKHLLI